MNIDSKRFPEGSRLVYILNLFKRDSGCSNIKIEVYGDTHDLSQIEKNLTELSEKPNLSAEMICAAENEAANILAELRDAQLHIRTW